ncbi:MAG: hypothetical protein HY791_07395 [Deltaproteobacteria bacterium]|nr:hypothetical protein [Deltaproteobacteria bacterium]
MKTTHVAAFGLTFLFGAVGSTETLDEYGDIEQTVARISHVAGEVSIARAESPDEWQAIELNVPVTLGDRMFVEPKSRVELEVGGRLWLRLGARSDLTVLDLREQSKQLSLKSGTLSVQLGSLEVGESVEVDTPNAAFELEQGGDYRIEVDDDGNSVLGVRKGRALVTAGGRQLSVDAGHRIELAGEDAAYDISRLGPMDGWDRWVAARIARLEGRLSRAFAVDDVEGLRDLDDYGRWDDEPEYGRVWVPAVEVGWVPFRYGRWLWQQPWGWTWVSHEPWGWAPYHYGRWVFASSRWCWIPTGRHERRTHYRPAIVGFVWGEGFVAWFPLGPLDPFYPWWGHHRHEPRQNHAFAHRHHVSVVSRTTFESGGRVHESQIQDVERVREASLAPVLGGRVPIDPTELALRLSERPVRARPAAVSSRSVVVRREPPAAPAPFRTKNDQLRDRLGESVQPSDVESPATPPKAIRVRPATPDLDLSPRGQADEDVPPKAKQERPRRSTSSESPARDRAIDENVEERRPVRSAEDREPITKPTLRQVPPKQKVPMAVEPSRSPRVKTAPKLRLSPIPRLGSEAEGKEKAPVILPPPAPPYPPPPVLPQSVPPKKAKKKGSGK